MKTALTAALILAVLATSTPAQEPWSGYTLITPVRSTETFLIDMDLNTIQTWHGDNGAGHTVYLLPDLSVLRSQGDPAAPIGGGGGSGGHLQIIDSNDNVTWDYFYSTTEHQQHHDIEPMPNGNVLLIAWEVVTREEALAAGRLDPDDTMLPTLITELEPILPDDARVVWEWRIWDHIIQDTDPSKPNFGVISQHPERIDVNLGPGRSSWDHANFIDYNPELDQIVFSARGFNEVFVIDHSTTREESRGRSGGTSGMGGDILYRWGNPQNYGRGTQDDQVFFGVHGANWIDAGLPGAGGILAFNNGARPGNEQSSVVEIQPPRQNGKYGIIRSEAFGPAAPAWVYEPGPGFYSLRYGSAFRMPNGNTLICEGTEGNIFEVNPDGTKVWVYIEPIGRGVFAAQRYWDPVEPKRQPRERGEPVALYPAVPNPFNPTTIIRYEVREDARVSLVVYDVAGRVVRRLIGGAQTVVAGEHSVTWDGRDDRGRSVPSGVYFYRLRTPGSTQTQKMVLMK